MRAVKLRAPGGLDSLEICDVPEPGAPGPGEILVEVRASSLNYHDYGVAAGPFRVLDGRIPLSDAAGVVRAVGEGVRCFSVGDLVVSCFFPTWSSGRPFLHGFETTPGDGVDGYAQERVVRPATWFTRAPKDYDPIEAATLTTAGLTAWRALVVNGRLRSGEVVLILGTGGVSLFALQIALAAGATVLATSSSDEKLEKLRKLGASHTVNYRTQPDWGKRIFDWTGGRGVDHVIEVGGAGTLPQSIAAIKVGGHIALIGVLTGHKGEIPSTLLMTKQGRLQGLVVGNRSEQEDFVRALETTGIRPIIDRTFPMEELADAFQYQNTGKHFGKIGVSF